MTVSHSLPKNITITQNQTNGRWIPKGYAWLVTNRQMDLAPAMENSSTAVSEKQSLSYSEKIYLYGFVPVKTVGVSVADEIFVVPGGECVGITLKTEGLLAVGIAPFETRNGEKLSPAEDAGIKTGDIITRINGNKISKADELMKAVKSSQQSIVLSGERNGKNLSWEIFPAHDKTDGKKKIGLWIRESVAGIGTVSFYNKGSFAALGHSISDIDTGSDVKEAGGSVCKASIVGIEKGEKGTPGSLRGVFAGKSTGKISSNSYCGVFGTIEDIPDTPRVKIASKNEVRPGNALLRCDVGSGTKNYKIEIQRIVSNADTTKNMIIKISDKELINKTGGIVQGMSGSPIIQNGKLVGAVTHVFVNDPTRGYAIFIENMLSEAEKN